MRGLVLQRASNREQPLRNPRLHALVNCLRVERHRNRVGLVSSGIKVLTVDEDSDRNERGFAVGCELDQTECAGPRAGFGATRNLSWQVVSQEQGRNCQDDESPGGAV